MLVQGTLTCLHCGHVAGEWIGPAGTPLVAAGVRRRIETADDSIVVRCARCRGPVFLDEATAVRSLSRLRRIKRLRRQVAELEALRRARRAA